MELIITGTIFMAAILFAAGGIFAFLKAGAYRQLLLFFMLLQIFTFAIKATYGVINSTVLALLPSIFLAAILCNVCLLGALGRLSIRLSKLDLMVLAFFILDFIQVFNPYLGALADSDSLEIGLRGFQQRSYLGLVYFAVRWLVITPSRFNNIVRVLAYTIALGGLYAVMQQLFGFDLFESEYQIAQIEKDPLLKDQFSLRAMGLLGSPFTFGLMSAIGLVCGIYLLINNQLIKLEKLFLIACVLLNGAAVFLSGSRSTYFSLIGMCVILIMFMRTSAIGLFWHMRYAVFTVMACLILVWATFQESDPVKYSVERIGSLNEIFADNESINDENFRIRRELITASGSMILNNPFGYGSGIFNGGSNPDGIVKVQGYSTFMDNEFVGLALELGLQGVLLFLAILVVALYRCRISLEFSHDSGRAKILAAILLICSIASIGGQWLAAYPVNIVFWTILGLIAGLPVGTQRTQYPTSNGLLDD